MSTPLTNVTHEEWAAAQQLQQLIQEGKAEDVLMTYAFCKQSCDYVYGILRDVAYDENPGLNPAVKAFALNLLDDWAK